jgi:hypothetical protein
MDALNEQHTTKYLNLQVYQRRNLKFEGILVLSLLWFWDISVINCVTVCVTYVECCLDVSVLSKSVMAEILIKE